MRKILISILFCVLLLVTGGTALAQGGGAGWFDFVTDVRLHGQVWILNDLTIGDDLTLTDDLTADAISAADITASDDVTATDDLVVGDDLTVGDDLYVADLIASTYTTVTVTDGSTITPTGMYQRISSAANTGTSAIANPTAGRLLILVNVANTTITLTDTGTLKLSGNAALAQYDAIQLLGDGTNWIQIAPEGDN